jgi:hypothetical protein
MCVKPNLRYCLCDVLCDLVVVVYTDCEMSLNFYIILVVIFTNLNSDKCKIIFIFR